MPDTASLALPLLVAEQAQKHVTHNEAVLALDAVVQLAVLDRGLAAPPVSPVEGDRYIVAASPSGAWSGQAGKVAAWRGGAWAFHAPKSGWVAWIADEATLAVHDGTAWREFGGAIAGLQNLALLGIATIADATNPFAAKVNKALWTAKYAADGGDGDMRMTFNKETAADVLSILMQRGFSGRAEIGLIGTDDFTFKVSADGTTWTTLLVLDKAGAKASLGAPLVMKSYTVAGLPSAATAGAGAEVFVTNESGGAVPAFSDGTSWRRVTDRAVVS